MHTKLSLAYKRASDLRQAFIEWFDIMLVEEFKKAVKKVRFK